MGIELIGILLVMGVAMYFFMIRPARKQQQKQQEMMNALDVGARVMLGSGIYGTIRHLGEKQAIIEVSPGVDLTVLRAAIRGVVMPEEEEFEYSDEVNLADGDDGVDNIDNNMDAFEADVASPFAPQPDTGEELATDTDDSENEK